MQTADYRPSLSTGIYGSYTIQHIHNDNNHDEKRETVQSKAKREEVRPSSKDYDEKNEIDEKLQEQLREKFFTENSDVCVPIKPIYYAAKEIDDKYKLIFKPECNYKGCCNKPDIDSKLLKGDMYICKKHRIKMANEMKENCNDNQYLKQAMLKLQTYDDKNFHELGKKEEERDYFLQNFSKIQQLKFKTAKQLSNINDRLSPEYWECVAHYKQLEQAAKLLVSIRKVSNPFLTILVLLPVLICLSTVDDCMGDGYDSNNAKSTRERRKREKERQKKIQECQDAFTKLNDELFENNKLKTECIKRITEIDGEIKDIEANYQTEIKPILDEIVAKTEDISGLEEQIKAMEKEAKKKTATIDKILELQGKLDEKIAKKHEHELELETKKQELMQKKIEFEKSEAAKRKAALELERQRKEEERIERERREDELNWERAVNRAEYFCRRTKKGRIALYVVYDDRKWFSAGYSNAYDISHSECCDWYGHYRICKWDAKYKRNTSAKFTFTCKGRYQYWYHQVNGEYSKSKCGDTVDVWL